MDNNIVGNDCQISENSSMSEILNMPTYETLDMIRDDLLQNLRCPLRDAAKNLVFGKGNPHAQIMFIGEAPGAKEDELGMPFVGAAGKQLDKLLSLIGLGLDDVYIANILKYRPPLNRNPSREEIIIHTPYLVRQINVIKPRVIVTLGNFSTKFVLGGFDTNGMDNVQGITTLHGQKTYIYYKGIDMLIMPSYHPAAMLYRPQLRSVIEADFLSMKPFLGPLPQSSVRQPKTIQTTLLE